jgi:hypothetical protein
MTLPRSQLEVLPGGVESMFDPFNDAYLECEARKSLGLPHLWAVDSEPKETRERGPDPEPDPPEPEQRPDERRAA